MTNPYDYTYQQLLRHIIIYGEGHEDRTGVGTSSVFGYQNRYDVSGLFPLLTIKKMAWKAICVELMWFLRGLTDVKWLQDRGCKIWNEWATAEQCAKFGRAEGDLGPVYGWSWRHFGGDYEAAVWNAKNPTAQHYANPGIDQILQLSKDLIANPGSRRLIVTAWDPAEATRVNLPPCHSFWQCKVRRDTSGSSNGFLDLHMYQRSADSFLGVPFNIASYSLLLALIAHTHNFRRGNFIHSYGDLHIYNNHRDQVNTVLEREPFEAPALIISDKLKGAGFEGLVNFEFEDLTLSGYQSHEAVKADVAV
jgi:thymidylate synthase